MECGPLFPKKLSAIVCAMTLATACLVEAAEPPRYGDAVSRASDREMAKNDAIQWLRDHNASVSRIDGEPGKLRVDLLDFTNRHFHWSGGEEGMRKLAALPNVVELSVQCPITDPESLRFLSEMKSLRSLHFCGFCIGKDAEMRHIGKCENLEYLSIFHADISAEGFANVANLKKLRVLDVHAPRLPEKAVAAVAPLKELRGIALHGKGVTDDAIQVLGDKRHLVAISLLNADVSDKSVELLLSFGGLRKLDLRRTKITQEKVDEIRRRLPKCRVYFESAPADGDFPVADPKMLENPTRTQGVGDESSRRPERLLCRR